MLIVVIILLIELMLVGIGIDIKVSPTEYLYKNIDIKDWINKEEIGIFVLKEMPIFKGFLEFCNRLNIIRCRRSIFKNA